jgi:photosystem II stability/assembly factor-like uncharacterized protein
MLAFLLLLSFASPLAAQWVQTSLPESVDVLCFAASGANIFAGTHLHGVFRSNDEGANWVVVNTGLTDLSVWALAVSGTNLFAGTNGGGVFLSTDEGASWAPVNEGLPVSGNVIVNHFGILGTDIFASITGNGPNGVYRSTNNGTNWTLTGLTDSSGGPFAAIGTHLFAGVVGGVSLSTDRGTTWTPTNTGLPVVFYVNDFAVIDQNVFAIHWSIRSTSEHITTKYGTNVIDLYGLYVSTDFGASWAQLNMFDRGQYTTLTVSGNNLFAGGYYYSSPTIIHTSDNGASWDSVCGLSLHTMKAMDKYLYVGERGVWKRPLSEMIPTTTIEISNDWNMVSLPMSVTDGRKEILFPNANSNAFTYNGSYESKDTLKNGIGYWLKFPEATSLQLYGNYITAETIAVSPGWNMIGSISTLLPVQAITASSGTTITSDFFGYNGRYFVSDTIYPGKGYWVRVNQGGRLILSATSKATALNCIRIVPNGEQPPPPPDGEIRHRHSVIPNQFALGQNYPNPFNPRTTISYQLPRRSEVTLKVFDVLGKEVITLVNNVEEPGNKSVQFDASKLTSGIYFYKVSAGSFTQTRTLLLLK